MRPEIASAPADCIPCNGYRPLSELDPFRNQMKIASLCPPRYDWKWSYSFVDSASRASPIDALTRLPKNTAWISISAYLLHNVRLDPDPANGVVNHLLPSRSQVKVLMLGLEGVQLFLDFNDRGHIPIHCPMVHDGMSGRCLSWTKNIPQ